MMDEIDHQRCYLRFETSRRMGRALERERMRIADHIEVMMAETESRDALDALVCVARVVLEP